MTNFYKQQIVPHIELECTDRYVGAFDGVDRLGTVAPGSSAVCRYGGNIVNFGKFLYSTRAFSPRRG